MYDEAIKKIYAKLNTTCKKNLQAGHRTHLGASIIGQRCQRAIWYSFRWVKAPTFTGQTLRLFDRGHSEETKVYYWLKESGFEIEDDSSQKRIESRDGHFGGSCDGIIQAFPTEVGIQDPALLEIKTSNKNAFEQLKKRGVQNAKWQHYVQSQIYASKFDLPIILYICICKDNDEWYIEIINRRDDIALKYEELANNIINSPFPRPKISEDPAYYLCKMCDYHNICHYSHSYQKNCRSCKYAQPIDGPDWYCHYHKEKIPEDVIPAGCSAWTEARQNETA